MKITVIIIISSRSSLKIPSKKHLPGRWILVLALPRHLLNPFWQNQHHVLLHFQLFSWNRKRLHLLQHPNKISRHHDLEISTKSTKRDSNFNLCKMLHLRGFHKLIYQKIYKSRDLMLESMGLYQEAHSLKLLLFRLLLRRVYIYIKLLVHWIS